MNNSISALVIFSPIYRAFREAELATSFMAWDEDKGITIGRFNVLEKGFSHAMNSAKPPEKDVETPC